jgi:L-lactate utilization protein LutC
MTSPRDSFLQRVRQAVAEGNRAGAVPPLECRGTVGYQGAGPDPVRCFQEALLAAGGQAHVVIDEETAITRILDIVRERSARKVLLGRGRALDTLNLAGVLQSHGYEVTVVDSLPPDRARESFFAADIGISPVEYLIAETGSVIMASRPDDPRSLSLLPPVHIAVAERKQLLPDLFDLFAAYSGNGTLPSLPSCLSVITGPSKTGDIELRLVTGVHGPGEVHVIVIGTLASNDLHE